MNSAKDPSQNASLNATGHCILCERPDSADNLVQCDRCDGYVHFSCAGVNDSISNPDRSFVCKKCTERDEILSLVSKRSSKGSRSSRRSAQLQLNLKRLEEENRLRMKKIDEEERFRKMRLEAEEEMMKKKFELLQAGFSSDDDQVSEKSGVSSRDVRRGTESWVKNIGQTEGACSNATTSASNHQQSLANERSITTENRGVQQTETSNTSSLNQAEGRYPPIPLGLSSEPVLRVSNIGDGNVLDPPSSLNQSNAIFPGIVSMHTSNCSAVTSTMEAHPKSSFTNITSVASVPGSSNELVSKNMTTVSSAHSLQSMTTCRSLTTMLQGKSMPAAGIFNTTSTNTQQQFGALIRPPERLVHGTGHSTYVQKPILPTVYEHQYADHNVLSSASMLSQPASRLEPACRNQMCETYSTTPPFRSIQSASYAPFTLSSASYPTITSSVSVASPPRVDLPYNQELSMNVLPVTMHTSHTDAFTHPIQNVHTHEAEGRGNLPPPVVPSMTVRNGSGQNSQTYSSGPSAIQIAARQVIPRELPIFSGNPQDWPLFHSSFQNSTKVCGYSDAENLARLQRCLRGHALEAVRSQLLIPDSVPHVIVTLERMYGRPEVIINALLKQLRSVPSPRADDLKTLIRFGMAVQNLIGHMIVAGQQQHLLNPMLLYELVERLPPNFKLEWANYKRTRLDANLSTFSEFMTDLVTMASDVTMHVDPTWGNDAKHETSKREKPNKEKLFVHHTDSKPTQDNKRQLPSSTTTDPTPVKTCTCCGHPGHRIADCYSFKRLDIDSRWKVVRDKGLCRICLVPHKSWPCRSKKECEHENCRLRHNTLLHFTSPSNNQAASTNSSVHQNHHFVKACSLLRYIPITLYGNGRTVEVFALLDDGSSSTILEAEVAEFLGVEGPEEPLHIYWTNNISRSEQKSQRIQLMVSGVGMSQQYPLLDVKTVSQLKLPSQSMNYVDLCSTHPHVKGLPMKNYSDAVPRIIIGVDNVKLINALKIREGVHEGLTAVKTRLGWCMYGRHFEPEGKEYLYFHVEQKKEAVDNARLHDLFKQFFNIEEACITVRPETEDIKRALNILHETTSRVSTGFEVGLLWKKDERTVPDSFPLALRRLKCLEKRLLRDANLYAKVRELIQDYIQKGYAHRATNFELKSVDPQQTWYLPLGVVQNPKKPNKVRLIWDAAATVQGLSFNDLLLKGPDLMVSLVAVLIRFRERHIAIGGDLREMFHQIAIRSADKQFLRFLWRDQPEQQPRVYIMDVAIFGASCSPCIAQFIKNINAEEFSAEFPRAAEAIIDNHYVDDYLDSVDTAQEAIDLMNQVKYIHANGGFEIRQFVSNSPEVLRDLGVLHETENKNLNLDSESERVLGMFWIPALDIFTFACPSSTDILQVDSQCQVPTKRQVLRIIMSVFDPLGLIAHYTIHGKILMQHIWRAGAGWDELIPGYLQESWDAWQSCLQRLNKIQIPRCILGRTRTDKCRSSELHAFVDASQQAYACAIYLRTIGESGVECSLIIAKTKVAPLKPVSIPRLELQAALIGARLMDHVCKNLTLPIARRIFWSDSSTVLSWLHSDSFRYHQYVAFRVGEILALTKVDEWKHVPSRLNVIDDATKWKGDPDFGNDGVWFSGPKFLHQTESAWPAQPKARETVEEQMRHLFHHQEKLSDTVIDVSRFSNWHRLLRTAAYVCRAVNTWKNKGADDRRQAWLSSKEYTEAENLLWKQVQKEAFPVEYMLMETISDDTSQPIVNKASSLYKLSPFLDQTGVMRMGSRIGAAPFVPYEAKYPVIIPKNHIVTFLLADSHHRRLLHANNETVVNDMRQRYYIPALRRIVKKVVSECQYCKNMKAVPRVPQMAPLPRARLTAFVKPFAYIGVDYFGPILVTVGRKQAKRWVALFTCLSIRAVHMEVVHSLSTGSCIKAFRRFVARRGAPLEVYSDNGTCFVSANKQLQKEIRKINEGCASTFTNARTKWVFNPPAAPHMGGLWERMVRSVKTAMQAIGASQRHPNEETFETIVLEAESVVNSRPLTYIALESSDQEALTPSHFLLYGTQGVIQPTVQPLEYRCALRDSWALAQWTIDEFWHRWTREYLPVLTRRSKWFEPVKPIQVDDMVIVVDSRAPRNEWPKGRVVEVFVAPDGQVRKAKVQTTKGILLRPAAKIAVLDVRGSSGSHGSGDVATTTGSAMEDCATGHSLCSAKCKLATETSTDDDQ